MEKLSSGKQIKISDHEKFDYLIRFLKKLCCSEIACEKETF